MTLTLATPAPVGIKTYPNGLKVIRLHEYASSTPRATLSVVTDSDSPAGKAVKDTQELAVATTNTGRGGSAADTISIPVADLEIGADAFYSGYVGIRVMGRPPIGSRAGEVWNSQNLSAGPSVCRVHDSTIFDYYVIPRDFYSGYTLLRVGSFSPFYLGSTVNVKFRAFGITGANMEFYLDLLYLIPSSLTALDTGGSFSADAFPPLGLYSSLDPDRDNDNSTNNSIGTAHSVMPDRYYDSVWDWDVSYDLQDNDDEPSVQDWSNIFFSDPSITTSFIYIPVGSRVINAHTLCSEDFSAWPGNTPLAQYEEVDEGYQIETVVSTFPGTNSNHPPGAWNTEWYLMNDSVQFLGPDNSLGVLPLGIDTFAWWSIGTQTGRAHPVSGNGSSDPRNVAPLLQGFDSIIMTQKVNLLMGHSGADVEISLGGGRWSAVDTAHQTRVTVTANVIHHANGTHSIELTSSGVFAGEHVFVSPVSVMPGLTPGNSYWVKVEKRYNHWRARCWVDGDAEPSTWDVEGFAPAFVRSTSLGDIAVDYPYNVNWPSDVTFIFEDPRYWHGYPFPGSTYTPWMHEAGITCKAGFNTVNYEIQVDEITFAYDPNGDDGNGNHTGAYFRLEKYDGSVSWGAVHVPPRSWRIIMTNLDDHHFAADTHGGTMYAWKEAGGHPLQVAAWEDVHFMHPGKFPRWGDITYP